MDNLSTSTLLYVTQTRQENLDKLIGHRFAEAFSWREYFRRVIVLCYSSTKNYLFRKLFENSYIIAIPFDLSTSTFKTIFNLFKNYLNLFSFLFKLTKVVKIDIIRLENIIISGPQVYLFSKIKKIPHVLWLGGYERKAMFAKYKKNLLTWLISRIIILFELVIFKNANFVYPVSDELLELSNKRNIKNKFYSPNYVDLSKFKDMRLQNYLNSKKKINLLYVGRFEEEKGLRVLLKAIKILLKENDKFELNLVGDGSLRDWILNFLRENKINNVKLLGIFDHNDMPKLYNQADIFILPSLTEGSPGSVIEAMGCGTASICTAVGECPKIINNGEDGILIEPGNPQILANAILSLISNTELIQKFRKNGRISALKRTKDYIKIHKYVYEKILKSSNV
ncbi:MAG: glycosyltransferase family 4 protein [Promethearchaeota archaeon]